MGLLLLLLLAAAIASTIAIVSIAWEALHPRRRTVSWALANGTPADPAALDPSPKRWRAWTVRTPDGAELPVWEIDGGVADGPIVVIVHGWGRSRWDSLRRATPLLAIASKFILPDLRGHGEASGHTRLGCLEVDDLRHMLERVDASRATPIVLMGHSMGAGIVIRAAADMGPDSGISGVVALAPYERVVTPIAARLHHRAMPTWPFASLAVLLLRAVGVRDRPLSVDAARLTVPLLVITAERDTLSPAADGRAIAAAAPEARGRMTTMPGGNHADPGIEDPIVFDQLLRSFIASVQRSSGEAGCIDTKAPSHQR